MANVDASEDVALETDVFEEFHYETQYVVLNYLGMVPPVLELGLHDDEESDEDKEKQDDEEYNKMSAAVTTEKSHQDDKRSPSTPDSQLLVGRLDLEEPEMMSGEELNKSETELENYMTDYNADESEGELCGVSSSMASSAGSSNVSHGTPILVVEQYMDTLQCYHQERLERLSHNSKLTTLVMPLREEVCQHLDTLDERRGCVSPRLWAPSPGLDPQRLPPPPSPEAIIASRIAAIGDQIMLEHQNHTELNSAVKKLLGHHGTLDYNAFKEVAKDMIDTEEPSSGWHQIASVLNFTRHVALGLMRKGQRIGQLTEYSVKLIEENMANFIVDQGGWEAVSRINIEEYSSSDLYSNASEFSLPGSPWPEGTLLMPPVFRKGSGSDVSDPGSGPPSPSWKDSGQTYHIPGRPHRLGSSNLLTPGNFRMLPSNQDMSVSDKKKKDNVTMATGVQDAATDTCNDESDSGRVDGSTQTSFAETDNSEHSTDSDADNGDVVASLFGFPGDSDSDSDSQRSPTRFKGQQQEVSTQTKKKKSWFSVSSAAALALGVGVGIAVMKK